MLIMASDVDCAGHHVPAELPPDSVLFGSSAVMQELKRRLSRICLTSVPVLLQGEVGVGKGVLSRFIHQNFAAAAPGNYLRFNCAALSGGWGLFALSAAMQGSSEPVARDDQDKNAAISSTVFLDQVCDLPAHLQPHLACLLANHKDPRMGEQRRGPARIISASTQDLRREVKEWRFRRDLFDLLAVVTITVPPLRDRIDDLPAIATHLRLQYSARLGIDDLPFPSDLLARMQAYEWPGNIRELETFVCRYVVLGCTNRAEVARCSNLKCGARRDFGRHSEWFFDKVDRDYRN